MKPNDALGVKPNDPLGVNKESAAALHMCGSPAALSAGCNQVTVDPQGLINRET
ncbi:MAG: hypothetical protein ACRELT_16945 [Longimicrobiales bacterium]